MNWIAFTDAKAFLNTFPDVGGTYWMKMPKELAFWARHRSKPEIATLRRKKTQTARLWDRDARKRTIDMTSSATMYLIAFSFFPLFLLLLRFTWCQTTDRPWIRMMIFIWQIWERRRRQAVKREKAKLGLSGFYGEGYVLDGRVKWGMWRYIEKYKNCQNFMMRTWKRRSFVKNDFERILFIKTFRVFWYSDISWHC